jgi:GTPase involved in cell partitioning and DNA repair
MWRARRPLTLSCRHAAAQVGVYAFTTVRPQLGVLLYEDGASLAVADIPGLVEVGLQASRIM